MSVHWKSRLPLATSAGSPRKRGYRGSLLLVVALVGVQAACSRRSDSTPPEGAAPVAAAAPSSDSEASVKTSAGTYEDVWCEGLTPERCGDFTDKCIRQTYCDGQQFCSSRGNRPRDHVCGSEGTAGLAEPCCEGLVARCGNLTSEGACEPQQSSTDVLKCLACGDGVCGVLEQRCNCPEDCEVTKARPRIRYRGHSPEGPSANARDVPAGVKRPGQCLEALDAADPVRLCLMRWASDVLGRTDVQELRQAETIAPFTAFDLDLLACLYEEDGRGSRVPRKQCLEILMLRTNDARLQKLLNP
ncbi:hypothetical protein [Myxococcus xanthus]|uniref:hypothetical protein n=1 Tax=Myxococcus xanthus TaxID=34 RepID=UPI0011276415|nr:hypothetical protein [Myxococcus xanthus]QDF03228.1 hypothetical protein BHS04_08350 [Myxococcus xanthus]